MAGAGKTTSLAAIREAAESDGYLVQGLAPTSRAARKLAESGIESGTLQQHLRREVQPDSGQKRLYVLDESSLARTKQVNELLHRLGDQDRILLVGNTRQPEAIARGDVFEAVETLDGHGRVHELLNRTERLAEMAREYVREPRAALAVSADNESRRELNALIRSELQERGDVSQEQHKMFVLDSQEMTAADRQWAPHYEAGDVVRYTRGSQVLGIDPGEYACLESVDAKNNLITIERGNGEYQTYDPRSLSGVRVYREVERSFSEGERVQFTASSKDLRVVNGELGTVEKINDGGDIQIRMDSGRAVAFNIREHPHLDYGYAVTSYGSQRQTVERVLIDADTDKGEQLLISGFAYASISRGQYDVQIYTGDRNELARNLGFDFLRHAAAESEEQDPTAQKPSARHEIREQDEQEHTHSIGFGITD